MESLRKLWNKPWRATSLPFRLRNWLLETATRVIECVSGLAMLGYAAVFQANGQKLVATELYYKFATLPLWAVVSVFVTLGAGQLLLIPWKTPRGCVLSGFVLVVSALVWFLVFAAFEASPVPANTGVIFPSIMAFLCAASGSRLIDLNKPK